MGRNCSRSFCRDTRRSSARCSLFAGKLAGSRWRGGGKKRRYIFLSMTRLNEAFARCEYELCGIQVTRNIGRRVASGPGSVQLIARSRGERTRVRRMINDVPCTPVVDSMQRSGMELSKACVNLQGPATSKFPSRIVSDGLKEISVMDMRYRPCRIN